MRMLYRFIAATCSAAALAAGAAVTYQWLDITPTFGGLSDRGHSQVYLVGTHVLGGNRLIVIGGFWPQGQSGSPFVQLPLLYSDDGGRSWSPPDSPLPQYLGSATMFVDVARPGVVYVATNSTPRVITGPEPGHLYRSEDFGRTWSVAHTLPLAEELRPFASDPLVSHGLYALRYQNHFGACVGSCVYQGNFGITRSRNDGVDWSAPLAAPPGSAVGPTPSAPTRLFISGIDPVTIASTGTFVSVDSGATWARADTTSPAPLRWIRPDPLNANVLYGYATGFNSHYLLRSDDGGANWRQIFFSATTAPNLTIDQAHPNVLWMPYRTDTIYRSENRGDTWQEVAYPYQDLPPNYDPGAVLVTSPGELGVVYLVRFGRLYRGVPAPARDPVVVEYHYDIDRYWITSLDGEAVSQDYRKEPGNVWRTGLRWGAWNAGDAPAGAVGSCRFWPKPETGWRTRVMVLKDGECESLRSDPKWILEGEDEFFAVPSRDHETCPSGLVPVRRFHNLQPDFNHRWVADPSLFAEMRVQRAWYDEGVRFCARPLGPYE